MRNDIRFAGIALKWTEEYAQSYTKKLKEMDYSARILKNGEIHLVAYSHKSFSQIEADECLAELNKKELIDSPPNV